MHFYHHVSVERLVMLEVGLSITIRLILGNSCSQPAENFLPQEAFGIGDVIGFRNWW